MTRFLKHNKIRSVPLSHYPIVLCFLFPIYWSLVTVVFAESPHEEYRQIQKDLKTHKKKLESVKRAEKSATEELRNANAELNRIEKLLASQRDKIKKIQISISSLQSDINKNKESIRFQGNLLKKRLRAFQRMSRENDALLILLSGEDFSRTLRIFRYISDLSTYDYKLINRYKEAVNILLEKQNNLKRLSAELETEEKKLTKLEVSLKEKKKERESLLVSVRKEKKSYEKMIKELQEASNRLARIIQESERRESELRKKRGARPGVMEEEIVEDSGFAKLKGKLPWPVNGSVAIQYGTQVDPLFNLPVFRSGIHINTSRGSSVKAVHEGKIVFADDFKGYGRLVIVSHGNGYHTLYGNLSMIFFKNGVIIKEQAVIGEVGESATFGTSGLYFELRYKGKPLDPQQWLRKKIDGG